MRRQYTTKVDFFKFDNVVKFFPCQVLRFFEYIFLFSFK